MVALNHDDAIFDEQQPLCPKVAITGYWYCAFISLPNGLLVLE